ncbi:hypothetical protein [Psychroflexus tropicus]|uniref:hypothetical protein n=1 Tax=Psychroflexus tropicus TaxID=197345 RepID=UPI00037A93FA|nr:hypothetical protein [Psychroflexus tropicus]
MKHLKKIFILTLILVGCKSVNIDKINSFYRTKYPKINSYSFTVSEENARNKLLHFYNKNNKNIDSDFVIIEYFRYPNGNFDALNTEIFFYQNDTLTKAYYLKSDRKSKIEDITNELAIDTKKTNDLILELLDKDEYEELKQLYKKTEYAVSDAGIIYVTFLDKNLNVLNGYMFNEFMVNEPFN